MRKAQGIGINVVIVAAIALLVLIIIAVIVMNGGINLRQGTEGCISKGGRCIGLQAPQPGNGWYPAYGPEYACPDDTDTCWVYNLNQ